MMKQFRVEDEETSMDCGFDFESFYAGFNCEKEATKVIIEGTNFHYAHLCEEHTEKLMKILKEKYGYV